MSPFVWVVMTADGPQGVFQTIEAALAAASAEYGGWVECTDETGTNFYLAKDGTRFWLRLCYFGRLPISSISWRMPSQSQ